MMKKILACAVATSVLTGSGILHAHHTGSAYATEPMWISGTVVSYQASNPHTITMFESVDEDGAVSQWAIEGPAQSRLAGVPADFYIPQAGDAIGFCAFPYKSFEELAQLTQPADLTRPFWATTVEGASPRAVAGHIMITPAGDLQSWEPHGIMAECIRSSDRPHEDWVEFLDTHSQIRQAWCSQRQYALIKDDPTLDIFVEEFNSLLDTPCP